MPPAAVAAGNATECNSPGVLRQAAYEYRLKQQLNPDMILELRMQKNDWAALECCSEPHGFIHAIGDWPFFCTFYLPEQLELYVNSCKSHPAAVRFDATGTVVKDIPDNKRVLYYCMIPKDSNVPVFEFLSSQHTAETLAYLLELLSRDARVLNNGTSIKPQYFVTDFSYAILNAATQALNKCRITMYLRTTLQILQRKKIASSIHELTLICLCIAYMLKCLSRTLMRLAPRSQDKQRRQYALMLFAVIARTLSIEQAVSVYRNIYVILCSECRTDEVVRSQQMIDALISKHGDTSTSSPENEGT